MPTAFKYIKTLRTTICSITGIKKRRNKLKRKEIEIKHPKKEKYEHINMT